MMQKNGCVYLVGAGCGSADLITLRGLELLRRCQVVVYDDLIDRALLDAAPADAQRIYVGKRSGRHSTPQEEICGLLIQKAREGHICYHEAQCKYIHLLLYFYIRRRNLLFPTPHKKFLLDKSWCRKHL